MKNLTLDIGNNLLWDLGLFSASEAYVDERLALRNVSEGIIFMLIDLLNIWLKEFINPFFPLQN